MKISLIPSKDIDKTEWDNFVSNTPQANLYGQSWYLDLAGSNWWGCFFKSNHQLVAVMPFFTRKKFLVTTIYQPVICQQLGIYSIPDCPDLSAALKQLLDSWLQNYKVIEYKFNFHNNELIKATLKNSFTKKYVTHHLPLNKDFSDLLTDFSKNHRRNIKKAFKNGLSVNVEQDSIKPVIDIFKSEKKQAFGNLLEKYCEYVQRLYSYCLSHNKGILYTVCDSSGTLVAGAFFIFYKNQIVYLFGANSPEGKDKGAMAFLFEHLIKSYSNSPFVLDFEGSMVPSIARFFKGFGAEEISFFAIMVNKFYFFEQIKKIIKNVRTS